MTQCTNAADDSGFVSPPGAHMKLTNVAPGNWAWQSSTNGDAVASRAVDGNANPDLSAGSCSQTTNSSYPIWAVDMEAIRDVHFVGFLMCDIRRKCSVFCISSRLL